MKRITLLLIIFFLLTFELPAQVRINEVKFADADDQIELKNFGQTAVDVSAYWFCSLFSYTQISTMTIVSGSLNIPPDSILAVSGKTLNDTSADLGLYNTGGNFASTSAMEDFVQWGGSGQGRESVAVSKGIWTAGDFVPAVAAGHSIEYDGFGHASTDWFDQATPSIGQENSVATAIGDVAGDVPQDFVLAQNYPNPFNPSTVITYTLPQSANLGTTRLEIYNLLGQKVRTLINARQSAGTHSIQWDGTNDAGHLLASGVYVYLLKSGNLSEAKKMLFMK
ncbi:MAG: FlgD immunoglobulin-like domain containing protein [bacterium]